MKYEKQYIIHKEANKVKEIFTDLTIYGMFHPLIKSVTKIDNNKSKSKFKIREQPYHWIPIKIVYFAEVKFDNDIIEYFISGIPFFQSFIRYELNSEVSNKTQVTFNLNIKGIGIGKKLLLNKMIKAQNTLIESINKSD